MYLKRLYQAAMSTMSYDGEIITSFAADEQTLPQFTHILTTLTLHIYVIVVCLFIHFW